MTSKIDKIKLSRAVTTDLTIPCPGEIAYKDFQRVVPDFSQYTKNILIADEPGLGKTIEMIAILNFKGHQKINLFVPNSLILMWQKELNKWFLNFGGIEIYHPKSFHGKSDVLIIGHYWMSFKETLKHLHKRGRTDANISDEVHCLKNYDAQITKNCFAPNGAFALGNENITGSGTPLENRPIEIFYLIKALAPEVLSGMTYFEYGLKYCDGKETPLGWDFKGASNLGDLGRKLRNSVMVRRTKKQVLKELPEKVTNVVSLVPNNKGLVKRMQLYEEAVLSNRMEVEDGPVSTLRRELGVAKVPDAVAYIKAQLDGGRKKVVVFAHHKEVIGMLLEGLHEYNPLEISGRVSRKRRDENVHQFQSFDINRVIVVSIRAGGQGLTLTAADYCVSCEYDWVPGRNSQCPDRCHRIGQLNSVQWDILIWENTLDQSQLISVMKKEEGMKELYDDEFDESA